MSQATPRGQDWKAHLLRQYERAYRLGLPAVSTPPLDVSVELNQTCNLRCPMCARAHGTSSSRAPGIYGDMDVNAEMDPAVLDAVTPWIANALAVHAYGFGEPLLSPLLEPLVERAKKAGAYVDFFTNGHLLSEKKAKFLVDWRVDRVVLSASGASEGTYARMHGGDLSALHKGADNLRSAKPDIQAKPRVDLNVILQRDNLDELEAFLPLGNALGAGRISFKPLMVYDDEMEAQRLDLGEPEISRRLRILQEEAKSEGIDVDWAMASQEAGPRGAACFMPWRSVFVEWNGRVRGDCFGGPILGDLHRQGPREIWEGDAARRFREAVADGRYPEACAFCLAQGLRPLRDDARDLFFLGGGIPPEPIPPEESRWGEPGPLRIRLEDAPSWSDWNETSTYALVVSNEVGMDRAHLVLSLYPRRNPSFPERHHGYWTFWNVPLRQRRTKLKLKLTSPRCVCELDSERFTGEFTQGQCKEAGEYVVELSLRSDESDRGAALRSRQVFVDSERGIEGSLDEHWPERRRRHPNWSEPDRETLLGLSRRIQSFASRHAASGSRIVDLGCGDKPYYPFFWGRDVEYVGVDLYPGPYVDLVQEVPPFALPSSSFDLCILTQVMEHLREPGKWVAEARRLLKPGGRLLLSAPLLWEVHYVPMDYFRFTEEALREALEGFLVEEISPCGSPTAALLQCRNLLSQRKSGNSFFSRCATVCRNLLMQLLKEEGDPTFTPNFVVVAQKPEALSIGQEAE